MIPRLHLHLRHIRSALAAATLTVMLGLPPGASAQPAPSGQTGGIQPFVTYNEAHPVLAYYYAWWDPGVFSRTLFQPDQAYNSDDQSIMVKHTQQAQAAGIDGLIVSWYGYGDRTDKNLAKLLELGKQSGLRATVHFETPLFAPYGPSDVVAQLTRLYQERLNHPAWVTYQGRPVIFFWRAIIFDNATWSAIRNQVDPGHHAVWIADGDNFAFPAGDAWDGISPYAIAWSANPAAQLPSWGAKAAAQMPGKLYIPPVSPGCDDTAARPATCIKERADGSYYQATLDGALASNPSWAVVVSTFNEWMESTQIEPSQQYGDLYLRMTRQFADGYKGGTMAPAFLPVESEPAPEEPAPDSATDESAAS